MEEASVFGAALLSKAPSNDGCQGLFRGVSILDSGRSSFTETGDVPYSDLSRQIVKGDGRCMKRKDYPWIN
jgi:hypothetical protein